MEDDPRFIPSMQAAPPRTREVGCIFAAAILRLHRRSALPQLEAAATRTTCLELSSETVLSVRHNG